MPVPGARPPEPRGGPTLTPALRRRLGRYAWRFAGSFFNALGFCLGLLAALAIFARFN